MSVNQGIVRVGTAGWNYKDWYGTVYPGKPDKCFKELDYLARFFDTAEINSTFYRPPNSFMASAWVRKVAHNPNFKFTAKLWQRFTHDRNVFTAEEVKQVTNGTDPLAEADKLGALLCQFPWSFRNDEENRKWLSNLIGTFHHYPLVFELRHGSWDVDTTYEFLDKENVGLAAIDQPVIGESIGFKPVRTGKVGYVRMHGRNYESWFQKKETDETSKKSPGDRYDYYYSEKEIEEIAKNVKTVSEGSGETYVIQNNHPWGQAVANALQLKAVLGEEELEMPATLLTRFPELSKIARPVENGETNDS
ncbi:DUF72 domain-containing protein [bacterium]|nr:DUF72 domain-containing protein [bacterium]